MDWNTVLSTGLPILVLALAGTCAKMWLDIAVLSNRLDAVERRTEARRDEYKALDEKLDDISHRLVVIETRLTALNGSDN